MNKNRLILTSLILVIMFVSCVGNSNAMSNDCFTNAKLSKTPKIVPKIILFENGDAVYSFSGVVEDKDSVVNFLNSYLQTKNLITANGYSYSLSGFKQIDFGNGSCYASFNSNLDFDLPAGFTTRVTITQANSYAMWTGTSPQYNANILTHSDTFTWNSIGSVSISTTGGGWSVNSNTATWSYTSYNSWYDAHTFGGLSGAGALTSISETSTGDFRFESVHTSITPTAYNSMSV